MAKSGSRFLPPSGVLDATLVDWGSGRTMHRVHDVITELEDRLKQECPEVGKVLIHPEPETDNHR